MKGTIDASIPFAAQLLMNDPKETAEHATIVDLIRNDLSMVANRVSVSRYRYMDRLQTNRGAIFRRVLKFRVYCLKLSGAFGRYYFPDYCQPVLLPVLQKKDDADYPGG